MNELHATIHDEIRDCGAITFARFMELALYHPQFGYYEQPAVTPGRHGDFYTSVSVGPLFGEMLAFQFVEWLAALPAPRQIVEAGAHDGGLARDIMAWLRRRRPVLAGSIEYWLIEPSAGRRERQEKILGGFAGRVRWFESWQAIPTAGVNGVIFCNELLDAFPFHRLAWDAASRHWQEIGVTLERNALVWTQLPSVGDKPATFLAPELPEELLDVLPDGFTTEACPAAAEWWRQAARALSVGQLLTLDYGLTREEFFTPERAQGTARAYFRHHSSADLLARPGEQDLTAQVNFSEIRDTGEAAGLQTTSWVSQAQFLSGILSRILSAEETFGPWAGVQNRQFQSLTHPEHLGRAFRILLQARN